MQNSYTMPHDFSQTINSKYRELWPKFFRVIHRQFSVLRTEDIQDLYQNAFMSAYDNIRNGRVTADTNWDLYIIKIGLNQANKMWRSQNTTDNLPSDLNSINEVEEETEERNESLMLILEDLIRDLNFQNRELLLSKYYSKLSSKEIALELGYRSPEVVKSLRSKLMKQLVEKAKEKIKENDII